MTPTTPFTFPLARRPLHSEGHISPTPHPSQRLEQDTHTHTGRLEILLLSRARTTHSTNHDTGASSLGIKGANHHTSNNRHQSCEHSTVNRPQNAPQPTPSKTSPIIHHSIKWQHLAPSHPVITRHTPLAPAPARTASASSPAYPRLPPTPLPSPPPSAAAAAPHTAAYAPPPA